MALGLIAFAAPAGAVTGWQPEAAIPGSTAQGAGSSVSTVGLADNGAAAVVWSDASDTMAATRSSAGGAWTVTTLQQDTGAGAEPVMAMNGAGDVVVAWADGGGIDAAYKPAGGAWESWARLEAHSPGFPRNPSVAIGSNGTALVAWEGYQAPNYHIHTAMRTRAGPWGGYEDAATESKVPSGSSSYEGMFECSGTAAAIDDAGRARVLWVDPYGSFRSDPDASGFQLLLCGVRTAARSSVGVWGAATAITSRPDEGSYDRLSCSSGVPVAGPPKAAFDPVTGKLIAVYPDNESAVELDPRPEFAGDCRFVTAGSAIGVAHGTVVSGVSASAIAGGLSSVYPAAGAGPGYESVVSYEVCGTFSCTERKTRGGVGPAGSVFGTHDLSTADGPAGNENLALTDVGGDGTAFFVFRTGGVQGWTMPSGGATSAPVTLFASSSGGLGIAANCHGDALAAVGTPAGTTHVADYVSGNPAACGGTPPVDTTPPDTTIDSGPADGATITTDSATFTFHGTAGDSAKLQCSLDGAAFADCTSPRTFSALANGSHTASFRAVDAAGNSDASPAARTFNVDVADEQPSNEFKGPATGKADTKKGTLTLSVDLPGSGLLEADQAKGTAARFFRAKKALIKHSEVKPAKAGEAKIKIVPSKSGLKKLKKLAKGKKIGKLKVPVKLTFTPTGGEPHSVTRSYKLKLK